MRELSLNILDITENSFRAGATLVTVEVTEENNLLTISVTDNGSGMDEDFLKKVTDPYATTRTTRKVGMGIPLIKMEAEMSGGGFEIESALGKGTKLTATFVTDNIDRPPLGDIAETMVSIIGCHENADVVFKFNALGSDFTLDTREVKKELDGVSIAEPEILIFLRELINENIITNLRGVSL